MTINKAIEILTMATSKGGIATNDDYIDAQKLGIEALKLCKDNRNCVYPIIPRLLPSETKE